MYTRFFIGVTAFATLSLSMAAGCPRSRSSTRKPKPKTKVGEGGKPASSEAKKPVTSRGSASAGSPETERPYEERPGGTDDAVSAWMGRFKPTMRSLRPSLRKCRSEDNAPLRRFYECVCRIVCETAFPEPPGGGRIVIRYPPLDRKELRLEIGPKGEALECRYEDTGSTGPKAADVSMTCPAGKARKKRQWKKSQKKRGRKAK